MLRPHPATPSVAHRPEAMPRLESITPVPSLHCGDLTTKHTRESAYLAARPCLDPFPAS